MDTETYCYHGDLPLNCHPASIRVSGFLRQVARLEQRRIGGAGRVVQPIVRCGVLGGLGDLDNAVLHRLSRRDKMPIDDHVLAPGEHGVAGELCAMVGRRSLPCRSTMTVRSRATRRPDIDLSGMRPNIL